MSTLRDAGGGIAVTAALSMMPVTLLMFAAVEFNRYITIRSHLQDAIDAATLAVARSPEKDPAKLQLLGTRVLTSTLASAPSGYAIQSAVWADLNGKVTGDATVSISPIVSDLLTTKDLSASAQSQVSRLGRKLELALVLDNTYSMLTNDRLGITKTAATEFIDLLKVAADKTGVVDALKVGLVPYSNTVNVGAKYQTASWIDGSAANPIHDDIFNAPANRFKLLSQIGVAWAGCVESREYPYDTLEMPPTSTDSKSLFVPYFAPDEPDDWTYGWTNDYLPDDTKSSATWQTKQKNIAKYDQPPTTTAAIGNGYNYGPNYGCTLQPLVPLTPDMAAVKTGIKAMTATGDTSTNIGVMWGWHVLSPLGPFGRGSAYDAPVAKIVVLMTDGENASYNNGSPNASIYSGGAYIPQGRFGITTGTAAERRAALDARMTEVCTNMKAKGIIVYTIRVEVTSVTGNALSGCASDPSKFFDVTQASQLSATFKTIADSLLNLRIAS
jgi:Flp pilus assembly protein TadG